MKTDAAQSAYAPEKLSMEKTVGAFSPEDRIGALELQNLSVQDNRALLVHHIESLRAIGAAATPVIGELLAGRDDEKK
jgi:argininosuccinate synthase